MSSTLFGTGAFLILLFLSIANLAVIILGLDNMYRLEGNICLDSKNCFETMDHSASSFIQISIVGIFGLVLTMLSCASNYILLRGKIE